MTPLDNRPFQNARKKDRKSSENEVTWTSNQPITAEQVAITKNVNNDHHPAITKKRKKTRRNTAAYVKSSLNF